MPKLNKTQAKSVNETEPQPDFSEPAPPGVYPLRLKEVEVSDTEGASGYHYWKVVLVHENPSNRGKNQWTNLSLSPKAAFKMREFFDAFEVAASTDTDELIGQRVNGKIGITTQQSGKGEGNKINEVLSLSPYDPSKLDELPEDEDPEAGTGGDDGEEW